MSRFIALFLLAALCACASGDPLPEPSGPWVPLNGWHPDEAMTAALQK